MKLSARSLRNLEGVHPDLVRVVKRAAELEPFIVTEGLRSLEKQRENIAKGVSWTLQSRHLTGHAVDVCDPDGCYDNPDMIRIGKAFKKSASELGIPIKWGALKKYGGDWTSRNDSPHFELDAKAYPASSPVPKTEIVAEAVTSKPSQVTAAITTGAVAVPPALSAIPSPPNLDAVQAWRSTAEQFSDLLTWATSNPIPLALCAAWVIFMTYLPRLPWFKSQASS